MNTFLPFADYNKSARLLDLQRLNKQISECHQIRQALVDRRRGYAYHPATLMWDRYVPALMRYMKACSDEYTARTGKVHTYRQYITLTRGADPWWWGSEPFHRAMRRMLRWKASRVGPKPLYVWPVASSRYSLADGGIWWRKSTWRYVVCRIERQLTSPVRVGDGLAHLLLQSPVTH